MLRQGPVSTVRAAACGPSMGRMTAAVHMVHDVGRIEELLVSCARNVITGIEPPGGVLLQSIRSAADRDHQARGPRGRTAPTGDGCGVPPARPVSSTQLQVRFDEHARVLPRGPARSTAELCIWRSPPRWSRHRGTPRGQPDGAWHTRCGAATRSRQQHRSSAEDDAQRRRRRFRRCLMDVHANRPLVRWRPVAEGRRAGTPPGHLRAALAGARAGDCGERGARARRVGRRGRGERRPGGQHPRGGLGRRLVRLSSSPSPTSGSRSRTPTTWRRQSCSS